MPSDQCNYLYSGHGLTFSLFDVTSALKVPFDMLQCAQGILNGLTSVFLYILLIAKSVHLVVAQDGFLSQENYQYFYSDYLKRSLSSSF